MRRTVVWIVGEPGVGKTTLVREMISIFGERTSRMLRPKWDLHGSELALAGHYNGDKFDGADTIPPGDIRLTLEYWGRELQGSGLTVFDGDKFSNANALKFIGEHPTDPRLVCLHLVDEPEAVQARRDARGTTQNAAWVKGRKTKSERFASLFPVASRRVVHMGVLRGSLTVAQLVRDLMGAFVHARS